MNIYVSNLSFQTTDEDLKNIFLEFGKVDSSKVIMDRESGQSRGFGFVEMLSEAEGRTALQGLNNKEMNGRIMSVSIAKEKSDRGNSNSFPRSSSRNTRW